MTEFNPPHRILLGPGPSEVAPSVLRAMSAPMVGHLDPYFLGLLDETKELLRKTFQTENQLTLPLSATGSAGMEACLVNLLEPGDKFLVGIHGVFGERMADIGRRAGAKVTEVRADWGTPLDPEAIRTAIQRERPQLVAFVHAETSTGVLQAPEPIIEAAHEAGALGVLDTVTSVGGMPVRLDAWKVDACYSGTQKCLSAPPGLSPVSFAAAATERLSKRKQPVQSWYLDLNMIGSYWGAERLYHHTAPISMVYALREALRLVQEEGLDARWERHRRHHLALVAGLEAMGLSMQVANPSERLWSLNAVRIPDGVDDLAVRRRLLAQHSMEIGGGLGPLKGKIWRIGLMGYSSTANNVLLVLGALGEALRAEGFSPGSGAGSAAQAALATAG